MDGERPGLQASCSFTFGENFGCIGFVKFSDFLNRTCSNALKIDFPSWLSGRMVQMLFEFFGQEGN